jgi:hypothetical protein
MGKQSVGFGHPEIQALFVLNTVQFCEIIVLYHCEILFLPSVQFHGSVIKQVSHMSTDCCTYFFFVWQHSILFIKNYVA